jgi:hypothetical protein
LWAINLHWLISSVKLQSLWVRITPLLYGVICNVVRSVDHPLKEKQIYILN